MKPSASLASCWDMSLLNRKVIQSFDSQPSVGVTRGIPAKLYKAFAPWGLAGMGWGRLCNSRAPGPHTMPVPQGG